MQAKILCVYDEGAMVDMPYIGAQGLSLLIEVDGQRTLFDVGMRPRYLSHNLSFLEISPDSIDRVAISHVHKEHTGGLEGLVEERKEQIQVFAPASAEGKKGLFKSTGLHVHESFADKVNYDFVDDWMQFGEHLFMSPPIEYDGGDECFLVLMSRKGPIVISGCSHCGVKQVMSIVKEKFGSNPKAYIGGVHLAKKDKAKAADMAEIFKDAGCSDLHLNHCTSPEAITELRVHLGLHGVENLYVGMSVEYEV